VSRENHRKLPLSRGPEPEKPDIANISGILNRNRVFCPKTMSYSPNKKTITSKLHQQISSQLRDHSASNTKTSKSLLYKSSIPTKNVFKENKSFTHLYPQPPTATRLLTKNRSSSKPTTSNAFPKPQNHPSNPLNPNDSSKKLLPFPTTCNSLSRKHSAQPAKVYKTFENSPKNAKSPINKAKIAANRDSFRQNIGNERGNFGGNGDLGQNIGFIGGG
jgi:hypothetical protein